MSTYDIETEKRKAINSLSNMQRLMPEDISEKFYKPVDARLVRVYYLRWARMAWHYTTNTNDYFPGCVDFCVERLQMQAENIRKQGQALWIDTRDALWIKFDSTSVIMIQVEDGSAYVHKHDLERVEKHDLQNFWQLSRRGKWAWYFETPIWRPELFKARKSKKFRSVSHGIYNYLRWAEEPSRTCPYFRNYTRELAKRCLGQEVANNLTEFVKLRKCPDN